MFYLIISFASLYFLYKCDAHNIVYNTIERKYNKWKQLKNIISTRLTDTITIYSTTFKIIFEALYINLLQAVNKSILRLDKNTYQVTYVLGGKLHKMIVMPKKGPPPIIQIRNENDKDVTETIIPYCGPNYDWHSVSIIPQFFGCKRLIFELSDGTQKIFEELDYIELN